MLIDYILPQRISKITNGLSITLSQTVFECDGLLFRPRRTQNHTILNIFQGQFYACS